MSRLNYINFVLSIWLEMPIHVFSKDVNGSYLGHWLFMVYMWQQRFWIVGTALKRKVKVTNCYTIW